MCCASCLRIATRGSASREWRSGKWERQWFDAFEWPTLEEVNDTEHLSLEALWDLGFTAFGMNRWADFAIYQEYEFLTAPCLSADAMQEVRSRVSFISLEDLEEELGSKVFGPCTGVE